ncbi:MAG: ATP-binding protein [Gemmatimonadaceae bacterium]|nr:ATP-binding protein [Gemmatimonadaceae bacterium]
METLRQSNDADRITRVVLTGSESVGKTTLAGQLAEHYGALAVPEFVREYAATKGAPLDFRDHGPIAKGQMALEDEYLARALARGDARLIHDTDLVSTVVYCHHYFGRCPQFIEDAALARRPAHYLLLDIDAPWVADGVRDRGDRRTELHALFEIPRPPPERHSRSSVATGSHVSIAPLNCVDRFRVARVVRDSPLFRA